MAKAVLLGMLVVFLVVSGCGKQNAEIVAEINGVQVTREQLDQKVAQFKNMFEMQGFQFEGEEGSEMLSLLERESLNQLITEALIYDEAKKLNISVSKDEVQSSYDEMANVYGKEVFKDLLKQQKMTEEQLKAEIELMLLQNSLYEQVTADVSISEEQLRDYFEANQEDLIQYRASHI
ncbi:MAG: hypothetical protein GX750_01255 [Clostridia bacterium]|nr:hypothetical protein [Clostridia bacterium]